jgi:hypothetical protein
MADLPVALWDEPPEAFRQQYEEVTERGRRALLESSVAFVGLARNCGPALANNLDRMLAAGDGCKSWSAHIESNDCTDNTLEVLADFCLRNRQATFHYEDYGRGHFPHEFGGRRTIALAEYRDACQRWVRACAGDADYVVVVDWDLWGGWEPRGIANAVGWMQAMPHAYGMASVSLFMHDFGHGPQWGHYDMWAARGIGQPGNYWDAYQNGYGTWGFMFLPPIGSDPISVACAFGGMAVYRTEPYLCGTYDGTNDCEHVAAARSIAAKTGMGLYMNPSQRTLVRW